MSDLPNLDAARAALEATLLPASTSTTYRAIGECGHDLGYNSPIDNYNRDRPLWCSDCGGYAGIDDVRAVEMLNHADMSVDAAFLRDALAAVDALTARLAEAEATLANERGEGEPPSEGWTWTGTCWTRDLWNNEQARVSLDATGLDTEVPRWRCFLESADDWTGDFIVPSAPTARAAMRDADSTLAAKVTP